MLVDSRELPDGSIIEADLGVIGGGMAGIALVRELLASGARIAVLESGGEAAATEPRICTGARSADGPGRPEPRFQRLPAGLTDPLFRRVRSRLRRQMRATGAGGFSGAILDSEQRMALRSGSSGPLLRPRLPRVHSPVSTLSLSQDVDPLGQRRLTLDWRLTQRHFGALEQGTALFARSLGEAARGRLRWPVAREGVLPALGAARHHLGATRMHRDSAQGVVDEHCRVHGVANLHIAGSSVFPTPGIVNPTLTIMAMTIRLADRMKTLLGR